MTRVNILCEISSTLHFLHSGGVIDDIDQRKYTIFHRDIKSSNICLDRDYTTKLIDCGLAQYQAIGDSANITDEKSLFQNTPSTKAMGTIHYMCPYIRDGLIPMSEYQIKCDVYSFGVVMLEMITGTLQMKTEDLTRKKRESLLLDFDVSAGPGWMQTKDPLVRLALDCVSNDIADRPVNFKKIAERLALIKACMTGVVDPRYYADAGATSIQRSCSICNCPCEERHSIICRNGHVMDANCCMNNLVSFCNIPMGRISSRNFGCPCCADTFDIEKLVEKIPFEYVIMLQERYDDSDNLSQRGRLQYRQGSSLEPDIEIHDSRLSASEVELKKVNENYVEVWTQLAAIATDLQSCPRYIIILPTKNDRTDMKSWLRDISLKRMIIYFVCEKSHELVQAFDQNMPHEWVVRVAPVVCFTLQTLLKTGAFGSLDLESLIDLAGCFSGLVREKYPAFSRICETLFIQGSRAGSVGTLDLLKKDECIVKVMKESYEIMKVEADHHDGWKKELAPIVTCGYGHRWMKKDQVTTPF